MKPVKISCYMTLLQILGLLFLLGVVLLLNKDWVSQFFSTSQVGHLGLVLNGVILLLFAFGLFRIVMVLMYYAREQEALSTFIERIKDNVANPGYKLSPNSLIHQRYQAVQTISRQHANVEQGALASSVAAAQASRLTLIRFVHNILILAGVFGTIVSLSIALIGAAGLLDSPENMEKMGIIIGGMSTALSTTITAIVCYVFFAYFHLRLQDARTQLLANLEEVTAMYILPRFRHTENGLLHDVAALTAELRTAAEALRDIQDRFMHAGDTLSDAVGELREQVGDSGDNIRIIRDSIRTGFRLEPVDEPVAPRTTPSDPRSEKRYHYPPKPASSSKGKPA